MQDAWDILEMDIKLQPNTLKLKDELGDLGVNGR
jgi:hypothetical protein